MKQLPFLIVLFTVLVFTSCKQHNTTDELAENITPTAPPSLDLITSKEPSQDFKAYWYQSKAEITSYKLEQARYGEIREGTAVLIYVTEDFLSKEQVKADRQKASNIPILKLNATKKFNTGIYPYSIMQSTFYPVNNDSHALKISSSMQEWCGHVYTQLNNRNEFEIQSHSYFEGQADQHFTIDKNILENELWTQLRIDPTSLPVGTIKVIPSLEYVRLKHAELRAYTAQATMNNGNYTLNYPELNRTLSINFNTEFPHEITGWEESFKSGYGAKAKTLVTKATKIETIKSAYWGKNSNKDEALRSQLQLD